MSAPDHSCMTRCALMCCWMGVDDVPVSWYTAELIKALKGFLKDLFIAIPLRCLLNGFDLFQAAK